MPLGSSDPEAQVRKLFSEAEAEAEVGKVEKEYSNM